MQFALQVSLRCLYRTTSFCLTTAERTKANSFQNNPHCWTRWAQVRLLGSRGSLLAANSGDKTVGDCTDTNNSLPESIVSDDDSYVKQSKTVESREEIAESGRGWARRLVTYSQLDFESDVGSPRPYRPRLIDDPRYEKNVDLWVQLIQFRRRNYGLKSLQPFLDEIFRRQILPESRLLESGLLEYAFQRSYKRALYPLCGYARRKYRALGYRCDSLYLHVMRHFLVEDCSMAYKWHKLLVADLPPSEGQFKELFLSIRKNDDSLIIFRELYKDLPFRHMYACIIPKLCEDETFTAATAWHHFLLTHGDLPPSSSYSEPLLEHLSLVGHGTKAKQKTQGLVDAGVSFENSSGRSNEENIFMSREILNRIHGETHGIAPKNLSDEFCARLFATKLFSTETVIKGLQVLGTEAVGPLALQEIALRACSDEKCHSETVIESLDQLKNAGISIGVSALSRLIPQLAIENEHRVLYDIVKSDLHPEVYEDTALQESLLASYERARDLRQVNRTLAVLLFEKELGLREGLRLNILFRSSVRRDDWTRMLQLLEIMKEQHIRLSGDSCRVMRECTLSERRRTKAPSTTKELDLIVNVWKTTMCLGSDIPPTAWIEILRRLGMAGELVKYEKLARWLGRWHLDASFRRSQIIFNVAHESFANTSSAVPDDIVPWSALHPCRILFSDEVVRAIVTWGFQRSPGNEQHPQAAPLDRAKIRSKFRHRWKWGLKLLVSLRKLGAWFDDSVVEKACVNRLVSLFGPGLSNRKINRRERRYRVTSISGYGMAMVHLWDGNMFSRLAGTNNLDARIAALCAEVYKVATKQAVLNRNWAPQKLRRVHSQLNTRRSNTRLRRDERGNVRE